MRLQGSLDSPLTALGREQALWQRQLLQAERLDGYRAFSSPQGRAVETARIALEGLFAEVETDPRLAEIGVGAWEGLSRSALPLDGILDDSEESALPIYELAPGGEGFAALHARCRAFLATLSGPSVLVTHGVTSRMLRLIALDVGFEEMAALPGGQGVIYHVENGRMRRLSIGA